MQSSATRPVLHLVAYSILLTLWTVRGHVTPITWSPQPMPAAVFEFSSIHRMLDSSSRPKQTRYLHRRMARTSSLDLSAISDSVFPSFCSSLVAVRDVNLSHWSEMRIFCHFFIGSPGRRQMIWTTPKYNLADFWSSVWARVSVCVCQRMWGCRWCTAIRHPPIETQMMDGPTRPFFQLLFQHPKDKGPHLFFVQRLRLFVSLISTKMFSSLWFFFGEAVTCRSILVSWPCDPLSNYTYTHFVDYWP